MDKDEIKIVVASGDYWDAYAPFPRDQKAAEDKVKRGMLKNLGMKEEEIAKMIDFLEIEFVAGADGMFDDGPMTQIQLVKFIRREPPVIDIPDPEPEPEVEKEPAQKPRQTMLQQFYGDRNAERRRKSTFDRFKSHVKKKEIEVYDEDGTKRKVEVYTVDSYVGKSQDSDELMLDGYQTRLERLSRAHQRDFAPYKREFQRLRTIAIKEIMGQYEEMHKVNPVEAEKFKEDATKVIESYNDKEMQKKAIQALIDRDTEFIETNNYTYNRRQNTAENLKTLGKDGEKGVKAQISDEQTKLKKFGLKSMNVLIDIRNHTKVPVNKAIGTYVASPIYRALLGVTQSKSKEPVNVDGYYITPMEDMLATSQKHSRGMFSNKPTHRYAARKDYFIKKEIEGDKANKELNPDGKTKRTTLGNLVKYAIKPRLEAIFNYKEGNTAILNAGLYEIEQATLARDSQMRTKRGKLINTSKRIANYEKELDDLRALRRAVKNPEEKEKIEMAIQLREGYKLVLEGRYYEAEREEIDSVSTDPVSMSQHDKANKSNITKVVRGVKTAARTAAGVMISKHLYREVAKKAKTPDRMEYIPGEIINEEVQIEVPGLDVEGIGKVKLEDIYKKGNGLLTYDAHGGRQVVDNTSFFRGIAFEYEGKLFSGSDGLGFDPTNLTNVKIDQPINADTSLVSLVQEVMQDRLGKTFSTDEIGQMIIDGRISGVDLWRATSENGIPTGWLNASEIVPDIVDSGTHTITQIVPRLTEGKYILKPGIEYTYYETELNPLMVALEAGLAAAEVSGWNELLRHTRSQENMHMRHPKLEKQMDIENDKLRAEKAEKAEKEGKDVKAVKRSSGSKTPPKKKREIKSFQRSNKSAQRYFMYDGETMKLASQRAAERYEGVTIFERFTGSKKEDFKSGYDENLIGVNKKEEPIKDERD